MERLIEEYRRRWLEAFDKEWGDMSHRQLFASGETIREQKDEIARLQAEIKRLRGRVVRLPWTRGDWAGTVDMIAYRGMVAEALDAAGVKWEMADG